MCETRQDNGTVLKTKGVQLGPLSCLSCVSSSHCFETENTSVQCRGGAKWRPTLFIGTKVGDLQGAWRSQCHRVHNKFWTKKHPESANICQAAHYLHTLFTSRRLAILISITDDRWQTDRRHLMTIAVQTCFIFWQVNVFNIYGLVTAFLLLIRYATLWPWPFDLRHWSYTADHMINHYTRLKILQLSVPELIVLTLVYGTDTKHDLDHISKTSR